MVEVTGVFEKQEFYETVHRTVSPKFVALYSRQIWIIPPQVRVLLKLYKKIKDTLMDVFYYLVEVTQN